MIIMTPGGQFCVRRHTETDLFMARNFRFSSAREPMGPVVDEVFIRGREAV